MPLEHIDALDNINNKLNLRAMSRILNLVIQKSTYFSRAHGILK